MSTYYYYDAAMKIVAALRREGLNAEASAVEEAASVPTLGLELVSSVAYELKRTNVAQKVSDAGLRHEIEELIDRIVRELSQ